MKTFKEILSEIKKEKLYSLIPGIEILRTKQQILEESAKRYARQVAQDALNRASEGLLSSGEITMMYPDVLAENITKTEIILP